MRRGGKPKFFPDGVLVVSKQPGPTSHDVVERLRRRFKPAKLGHCGTLDPFASGVLVLTFNRATRLSALLGAGEKLYQAGLLLGQATDTGDLTGQVIKEAPVPAVSQEEVKKALEEMKGEQLQAPPAFSAAKHQGKPLYAYARQGIKVEKPPKTINVSDVELVEFKENLIEFRIRCSQGTYVRSLGQEMAERLGSTGHLVTLSRLASTPFTCQEAVELDQAQAWTPEELERALLEPSQALARCGLPAVSLDEDRVWQLRQGCILEKDMLLTGGNGHKEGAFRVLSPGGELVAVLRWLSPAEAKPGRHYETIRVFPERP